MSGSMAKGLFFVNLSVLGAIAVLAIYQVPQPWRGILVGWLLFLASVGWFALRLIKHHYEYKSLQLKTRGSVRDLPTRKSRKARHERADSLQVVRTNAIGKGRHVIR